MGTGADKKDKCWRDALTLNSHSVNPGNGHRVGIQIGVDTINKKICIMKDTRNLSEAWNISASSTDASMTASGSGLNPYISSDLGTISVDGDANYDDLRKQIYGMEQIKNDVKSYKHLFLSWVDFVHQIPLSFPMLKRGKLAGQKNFNSAQKKLCIEVLDEEIEAPHKHSRCLHIHLAKIQKLDDKPIEIKEENENESVKEANKKESEWADGNYAISYWPFDHHLREKYDILLENVLIAMFRTNQAEWILIDDSCDNEECKQGLGGKPFNIKKAARHTQIFAVFDLSQCDIDGTNEQKRDFIQNNLFY